MRLVSAQRLADLLDVDRSTVLRWARDGRIPARRLRPHGDSGRALYRFDLRAVLQQFEEVAPPDPTAAVPLTRGPVLDEPLDLPPVEW